jgi:hypothetical protein
MRKSNKSKLKNWHWKLQIRIQILSQRACTTERLRAFESQYTAKEGS